MAGSGPISLGQVAGLWVAAGGPGGDSATIAAYIAQAESGLNPGAVQRGQPYSTTGWGLWQITPGDSESQVGVDFELLDPYTNALAAVAKYRSAGGWSPWRSDPAWARYVEDGEPVPALALIKPTPLDPGQWVPDAPAPAGVHNASQPGVGAAGATTGPTGGGTWAGTGAKNPTTGKTQTGKSAGSGPSTIATVPTPASGTGLSVVDMVLSPGSLGEAMVRLGEVIAGALLMALALLAFAAALTGRDVSPTSLVAGVIPGGGVLAGVWNRSAKPARK